MINLKDFSLIVKKETNFRSPEEIKQLVEYVSEYLYKLNPVNKSTLFELCKNAEVKKYKSEDKIFDNRTDHFDFIIISGSANIYKCEEKACLNENDEGLANTNIMKFLQIINSGENYGSSESEKMQKLYESSSIFTVISNNECEICLFSLKNVSNEYTTFDPDIYLIDNPKTIYEVMESVKSKIDKEFDKFKNCQQIIENFSKEKEVVDLMKEYDEDKTNPNIISKFVENKLKNYDEDSKLEVKLGLLIKKSLKQIERCNKDIKNSLDDLKDKFYTDSSVKNRNMMKLNIEEEIKKEEFKDFMIDIITDENNISVLIEEKKRNEDILNKNKQTILKEENHLLDTFYCVKCHIQPRNAISKNCHHLMTCEECILKTKICPRCGIDIDKFEKIFRC